MTIGKSSSVPRRAASAAARPVRAEVAHRPAARPVVAGSCCDSFEGEGAVETPPDEGLQGHSITQDGRGRTHVQLGPGSNTVHVERLPDLRLQLVAQDQTVVLTAKQSKNVVIDAGAGNDTITLGDGVGAGVRIKGGPGNDHLVGNALHNELFGGAGDDLLEGRGGDDLLASGPGNDYGSGGAGKDRLYGGQGSNVLHGGSGDDVLQGGPGRDYLDGGPGDDSLRDLRGVNQVLGGEGNDTLEVQGGVAGGGSGKDILTLRGPTHVLQDGVDTVKGRGATLVPVDLKCLNAAGKQPGSSILVKGDAEFCQRVSDDLETMRSLPTGRALLIAIDDAGRSVRIDQSVEGNSAQPNPRDDAWLLPDGKPGAGADGVALYNPARIWVGLGLDKFTNLLTDWTQYLSPLVPKLLSVAPSTFMHAVGIIEIAAGVLVLTKWTRLGAYVVSAWMVGIALNLLTTGQYFDVAVRDLVMAIGAFTLAKLSEVRGHVPARSAVERSLEPATAR